MVGFVVCSAFSVRFLAPSPPQHGRAVPQLRLSMARASNLLVSAVLFAGAFTVSRWAFVAPNVNTQGLRQSSTALAARGGGEYDISDADIQTELLQLTVDSWSMYLYHLRSILYRSWMFNSLEALGSMSLSPCYAVSAFTNTSHQGTEAI